MIELTEELRREVRAAGEAPVRLSDPESNREYVLLPADVYERLQALDYDDSPWTDEEMDALALEAGEHAGWDDMGEYDTYEKPQ
jgi:hypothetical protein